LYFFSRLPTLCERPRGRYQSYIRVKVCYEARVGYLEVFINEREMSDSRRMVAEIDGRLKLPNAEEVWLRVKPNWPLEASAIKDNTLMPGEVYGGKLHIDRPASNSGKAYSITIHVGLTGTTSTCSRGIAGDSPP
jgi:hypothetical protein